MRCPKCWLTKKIDKQMEIGLKRNKCPSCGYFFVNHTTSTNFNRKDIDEVMGKLRRRFNNIIENSIPLNKYKEEEKTEHFKGIFEQFALSGGKLNPDENLINQDGVASVKQDIQFKIALFPNNIENVQPFRLEVNNNHKINGNKIIHINPAGGGFIGIPHEDVEKICPKHTIDLVRISSSSYFETGIVKSFDYWKKFLD